MTKLLIAAVLLTAGIMAVVLLRNTGRGSSTREWQQQAAQPPPAVENTAGEIAGSRPQDDTTTTARHNATITATFHPPPTRTRPLTSGEVQQLMEKFARLDDGAHRAAAIHADQPPSDRRQKTMAANERGIALRRIARAEANAGRAFEVLEGTPPISDSKRHMYTTPKPGKSAAESTTMWVIPLSKDKYPVILEFEHRVRTAERAIENSYCDLWNRLPFDRRQAIVRNAATATEELRKLTTVLRSSRESGASKSAEYTKANRRRRALQAASNACPLRLAEDYTAIPGRTSFNTRPPDR